jgi:hypothetical protein
VAREIEYWIIGASDQSHFAVGGAEAPQDAVQGFMFLRMVRDTGIGLKSMTSAILGKVLK